jgi:hypothetical protein
MRTSVILGLLLVLVIPTTALTQSPLPKDGSGTTTADDTDPPKVRQVGQDLAAVTYDVLRVSANDAGQGFIITEDRNIDAPPFGSPSSQIVDNAGGSAVLLVTLLVQGMALAFLLWKLLGRPQRQRATLRRAFTCPFRGREVIAEFQLDVAERPIDVVWCTAFRPPVVTECRKQCLSVQLVRQGASRERSGELGLLHAAGRRLSARGHGQAR